MKCSNTGRRMPRGRAAEAAAPERGRKDKWEEAGFLQQRPGRPQGPGLAMPSKAHQEFCPRLKKKAGVCSSNAMPQVGFAVCQQRPGWSPGRGECGADPDGWDVEGSWEDWSIMGS